jgi:uncharacterized protein YqeY
VSSDLKTRILEDVKAAMRARDRERLEALRMLTAAIKQREVDERVELDDAGVLQVLDKMVKQRKDSERQFRDAGREELADKEAFEIRVIGEYLPEPLEGAELDGLIDSALAESGAAGMKDMGKVMGLLRPKVQGRADMGAVSAAVKARLGA